MDIPLDHVTHFGSFCDEFGSAHDPRKKYVGIAGLLGRSDKWSAFDEEWKEIQRAEQLPNPFHMTDFVHQTENFNDGWDSQDKRIRVLLRLLSAIERAEVMPVGASVALQDFRSLTAEQQAKLRHPYFIAFQEVTSHLAFAAAVGAPDPSFRTDMTYAKLRGYTGQPRHYGTSSRPQISAGTGWALTSEVSLPISARYRPLIFGPIHWATWASINQPKRKRLK